MTVVQVWDEIHTFDERWAYQRHFEHGDLWLVDRFIPYREGVNQIIRPLLTFERERHERRRLSIQYGAVVEAASERAWSALAAASRQTRNVIQWTIPSTCDLSGYPLSEGGRRMWGLPSFDDVEPDPDATMGFAEYIEYSFSKDESDMLAEEDAATYAMRQADLEINSIRSLMASKPVQP